MLKPLVASPNHEEVFLQRYKTLRSWALHLVQNDPQLAEDLLHDTFLHFTLVRPDLKTIENLDGYLHRTLRNMHLSQLRRTSRMREATRPLLDYDSATIGLETLREQTEIQAWDELRRICEYALLRKSTSKNASILILRFFHAYYPAEIAKILCTSRNFVDRGLCDARAEAKAYLADPKSLAFIHENRKVEPLGLQVSEAADDTLVELRNLIFRSSAKECPATEDLRALFRGSRRDGPDCETLAHIVCCEGCLDAVNKTLGLPLLSTRDPMKNIIRASRSKKKSGGGPPASGSGDTGEGEIEGFVKRNRRRAKEVLEHHPKEIRISVNGFIVGAHTVNSELSRQTLTVNLEERISFVEVFSEQEVRLMFCDVEPPPEGRGAYRERIRLSEGRSLELDLDFAESRPQINVIYSDPTYRTIPQVDGIGDPLVVDEAFTSTPAKTRLKKLTAKLASFAELFGPALVRPQFWLRPATATGVVAIILFVFLALLYRNGPRAPVTASFLLQQAATLEQAEDARVDQVLHRTINLEEKNAKGELLARRRIEVWRSAELGIKARRLFDERGNLVAGEWQRRDGIQTLYHHRAQPQLQLPSESTAAAPLSFAKVWRQEVSAQGFTRLIGNTEAARVEEFAAAYRITFAGAAGNGLLKAELLLGRADLRAIEETLFVREGSEEREYHFTEATFERHSPATVAPRVFEPEPELTGDTEAARRGDSARLSVSPHVPIAPSPAVATPELEVEVLRCLSQAGADMGEEISVTRTPEGKLQVRGIVETAERKSEILRSLNSVTDSTAISLEIETVAEALKRQPQDKLSGPVSVEKIQPTDNASPVQLELRRYFALKGEGRADEQARRFSDQMIYRSSQAMRHAWALKRLLNQFSAEELRTLAPEAKAKWLALVQTHAREFAQETRILRQQLQPIFLPGGSQDTVDEVVVTDDSSLARAVAHLFELGSVNDGVIRSAFLSTESGITSAIRGQQFLRSLKSAESQAAKISSSQ
jgi:RNA polymerase sigma factor (sigma-70 family)